MRLLTRYILKQLFMPFIFSLLIIVFVLFTQFLLRAIDRFIGKGLDLGTKLRMDYCPSYTHGSIGGRTHGVWSILRG